MDRPIPTCLSLFALCGRPPEADDTFGATTVVTAMLMPSYDGSIKLLPALPDEWVYGEYKRVVARGAFELDFAWKDKKITSLLIKSKAGGKCRIEDKPGLKISSGGKVIEFKKIGDGLVEYGTSKDGVYSIE